MKKSFFALSCVLLFIFSQPLFCEKSKPLYKLPAKSSKISKDKKQKTEKNIDLILVGSDKGLFKVTDRNVAIPLMTDIRIEQIASIDNENWMIRTEKGFLFTKDFNIFEERNNGLSFLTIKKYENKEKSLEQKIQHLKDFCINPLNKNEMVTATKDNVFYSDDEGKNWKKLGSMSKITPGIKAVAVATINEKSVVMMSHSIYGFSYIFPNEENSVWTDVEEGFEKMISLSSTDEIADILPVIKTQPDGSFLTEIYISQTYLPRIYKFDFDEQKAELIYKGNQIVDVIDGLYQIDDSILFSKIEGFSSLCLNSFENTSTKSSLNSTEENLSESLKDSLTNQENSPKIQENLVQEKDWNNAFSCVPGIPNSAYIPQSRSGFSKSVILNELWLLYPGTINSPYAEKVDGKKSIYASVYQCRLQEGIDKFKKIVKDRNMNSIVIDMKDDYGLLRYDSHDELVLEKATTSKYAIPDLNHFISEFKKENIYLIARIPTFKDRSLYRYDGGKYAVWDRKTNEKWQGIQGYEDELDENENVIGQKTKYYDEHWVDPYCEEVWEYNIQIAKELVSRGFDEIQFDYIRFPTDGINLYNIKFRWQDKGMDKESALISFLSYARKNIDAPIGIDIYGANGWYRSGTGTGQDAEMLCEFVDVIGPMFYPSHFEQTFLNYSPQADRTYRIYFYGSFRNSIMVRNRSLIRPWIQSFYLNVSYDKLYYDSDYIQKQFFGVRDAINRGYMCWNNSGEYGVTPSDITETQEFTGTSSESNSEYRKPAIGTRLKPLNVDYEADLSILDSILEQPVTENQTFTPFLKVLP